MTNQRRPLLIADNDEQSPTPEQVWMLEQRRAMVLAEQRVRRAQEWRAMQLEMEECKLRAARAQAHTEELHERYEARKRQRWEERARKAWDEIGWEARAPKKLAPLQLP